MPCCQRTFTNETIIEAPPGLVYQQLTDFDKYSEWNAVIPAVRVKEFKEGSKIRPTLVSPSHGKISFRASLSKVDPDKKIFEYKAGHPLPFMFKGEHRFIMAPGNDAGTTTRFIKVEEYSGLMVPLVASRLRGADSALNAMIQALKSRAEATVRGPVPAAEAGAAEAPAAAAAPAADAPTTS